MSDDASVSEIVHAMGGNIEAHSAPNEGSIFTALLPRGPVSQPVPAPLNAMGQQGETAAPAAPGATAVA